MLQPVPFDPAVAAALSTLPETEPTAYTAAKLPELRAAMAAQFAPVPAVIGDRPVDHTEHIVPGPAKLAVTVFSPRGSREPAGCLYNIHGGGMMLGNRDMDTPRLVALVLELGVVAVNIEYRLAPEHPDPVPVEDCYAGLLWTVENGARLGLDPDRVVVMGGSAGGGLAAGVALLARDRGGPRLAGQLLLCPMIDDTDTSVASRQYAGLGPWPREVNRAGWAQLLGERAGTDAVSQYAAPSRATEFGGLPPAFIEVGSAEGFRDEDVEYASRIWAAGGRAELHVWSGGCHGFDLYAPDAELTRIALTARASWLQRVLGS
ncbi:alpha/beta hydrolase [Sciscionella marina]|uniref:alpha/beta hydrolase n=1 Tax=Sciscionella marina TaxID=508770 RepID=UPI0003A6CC8B|nr:alpha/beta hydrolase fold domain-containing protein [Sciscionella marina]